MRRNPRLKQSYLALLLAFPSALASVYATEPYPALPPAMSTAVTPNIMLYIDTSASMLQNESNQWMWLNICNLRSQPGSYRYRTYSGGWSGWTNWSSASGNEEGLWSLCVNGTRFQIDRSLTIGGVYEYNSGSAYRNAIDATASTKMSVAKRVAVSLIDQNRHLRFGLFSFRDQAASIGDDERGQAAVMRSPIREVASDTERNALVNAINAINGRTATPLGEGLLEIAQYFKGGPSLYGLSYGSSNPGWNNTTKRYVSPVQYRCQKNFTIVITDGDATDDQNLPGSGKKGGDDNATISSISYTARNESGGAVSKSFSICKSASSTADDGFNVTCPATYESDGSSRDFGSDSNRPAALRDVAMYAYRADLREGGTDLDSKSFDDPKFALQNMYTYTVGYKVANQVLPSAAKAGGGKYYSADNETQLMNSLNNAISSIGDITSNAGGIATTGDVISSGNKVFQPVFNPKGWYGELRCFELSTTLGSSTSLGTACSPAKAMIPSSGRSVLTNKVAASGAVTPFYFTTANKTNMTAVQLSALGSDSTSRDNLIKFILGDETISGFRRRTNGLLGDIIGGRPLTVTAPTGYSNDGTYETFKNTHAQRGMVFVGANDGMLHGFNIASMNEIMGYIPSQVYPRLAALKETDYGQSAGTPHVYHVNGPLRQADVKLGSNWTTLLVGGLAQGGQGYFALDVTSESVANTTGAVKWEWSDAITEGAQMGYSFGAPIIYNVRTSATTAVPAVIFANGYENDFDDTVTGGQKTTSKSSALYVVRASDGVLLKKIVLPAGSQGLSSPAGVDFGQDGVLDYVYAGDINGNLWRFDLTSSNPASFNFSPSPIFVATDALGNRQPIIQRPAITPVNAGDGTALGNLVLFGTGKLLVEADRSDTKVQSFYAVLDDMTSAPGTIQRMQLLPRTIVATASVSETGKRAGTYRKISTEALDLTSDTNTKKGWYLDFPESTERLVSSPLLLTDKLLFGTGIPAADEKCVPGGKGWVMGLNPLTGSVTASNTGRQYSFLDIKLDGVSTDADKVAFSGGTAFVSGFSTDGIPTELSYVSQSARTSDPGTTGSLGDAGASIAMQEANSMSVYTGNAASGTSTGRSIGRPVQNGKGKIITCVQGQAGCLSDTGLPSSAGVKIETTLWREIK